MAAMAYPSNRPKVGLPGGRDSQPTTPGRKSPPVPDNDNLPRRRPPVPANDNIPKPGRMNLNPLPRAAESFPHLPPKALALLEINPGDLGALLLIAGIEWAGYVGGAMVTRVGNNWTQTLQCPKTPGYQWNSANSGTCAVRQSGLAASMKSSPEELLAANPGAIAMTHFTSPYQHPTFPNGPAVPVWDVVQTYVRVTGQPALPAPRNTGIWSPAAQPLEVPWEQPWFIPAVDPLSWPIGVPQLPMPVPYPMIPRLPSVDPNRDPLEQPSRGPRPSPRPRPGEVPGARPVPGPSNFPLPEPYAPGNLPSVDIHIDGRGRVAVNPNGAHGQRPPGKGEKEKKGGSNPALRAVLSAPGGPLAIGGALSEMADLVDALYKSVPARVRRWRGRDGKWREAAITPTGKIQFIYENISQVDLQKFQMNWLKNEIGDAVIGLASKSKGGRAGLGGFGGWHAGPAM